MSGSNRTTHTNARKQADSTPPLSHEGDSALAIGNLLYALNRWKVSAPGAVHEWQALLQACGELLAAAQPQAVSVLLPSQAVIDVMTERQRLIEAKGYSRQHDADLYDSNDLARAAAFYAMAEVGYEHGRVTWPWEASCCKPESRYLNFTRAAALLIAAAELEQARMLEPKTRVAR